MRFKIEVIADESGTWSSNQQRFTTRAEAEAYAQGLALRWTAVRKWRVIDTLAQDIAARRHNMGSVSTATMLSSDLIPCFVANLESQKTLTDEHRKLCAEIQERMGADEYFESDDADEDMDALFTALEEYAPEGFYFGSHPGDGADYGFWLSETYIADFEGLKVDDLGDVPASYEGEVLIVNDHGNVSLYVIGAGETIECWGVV